MCIRTTVGIITRRSVSRGPFSAGPSRGGVDAAHPEAHKCAIQLYRYGKFACKAPGGAFALYAGRRCSDPIGPRRQQRLQQILNMLDHGGIPWPAEPRLPAPERAATAATP